jgi:ribose transport system substrate-binding protein
MNIKSSKKTVGTIASMFLAILFIFSSNAVYAKSYEVAYLSASSANTWLGASVKTMEAVAASNDINITEFDGQFDPAKQNAQLQDIIASGKYQGIIVCAAYGVGMIPDLKEAIAAGIEIVVLNQIVGPNLNTSDPQVEGIAASVLASPYRSGQRHGELTVKACEGDDNCEVVFIYGIKGIPIDDAIRQGFDDVISQYPSIKVIAEGEGKYLGPEGGITATQDILSINSSFDVMVGADQSIQGAAIVLADEGMIGKVKLIGLGGSAPAIEGIKDGSWFGGVYGAPGDEGRYAMEAMVDALKNGVDQGGIDPLTSVPDNGLITSGNVFKFSAQWDG